MMDIETKQALADLQAVRELGADHPDILEALGRLIDEGTSVLQIDRSPAPGTGQAGVRYKLADELGNVLAAVRAGNVDPNKIEGSSSGHDAALPVGS